MNKDVKMIQIALKLDANKNGQLTAEELSLLSHKQVSTLRNSVSEYLALIQSHLNMDQTFPHF